jgi:mono/diheme cytochrome c family protein
VDVTLPFSERIRRGRTAGRIAAWAVPCLLLAGGCRQDMHDAPRYDPLEASALFTQGASARPLVEGTVARGLLVEDELLTTGKIGGTLVDQFPFPITAADLNRGEERFNVFCAPCHSRLGDGQGMVVQRGYRMPPTFHDDRLRQAPAGHFFDVMTNGFGVMPDYRAQVPVADRWRIVAYIRALQLSQSAAASDVPDAEMARLQAGETTPAAPPAPAAGHE